MANTDVWSREEIRRAFEAQRQNRLDLKRSGASDRIARLERLRAEILRRAEDIDEALFLDMRRARMGAKNTEIGGVLHDIAEAVAGLAGWMRPTGVEPSARLGPHEARIEYEPRGVVLLLGPWNFPFALIFAPLVPIVAAGNACIVKPNEMQPHTSRVVTEIIEAVFPRNEVACFEGGVDLAEALQELPFDHVFFTGSPAVGKKVMAAAARHLSSVTLELGGKCPAVVDGAYDLKDAARKICSARFTNAGQLCLSVDHVWVPRSRVDELAALVSDQIGQMFYEAGEFVRERQPRLVDPRNFQRVKGYLDQAVAQGATIRRGGGTDEADLTIEPTVLTDVPLSAEIMQQEIFGPLLPLVPYDDVVQIADHLDSVGKPLALYVFSNDAAFQRDVLDRVSSGGVTINNVIMHYLETQMPFGGVNSSGIGAYKGVHGFRELSHARSTFVQQS